MIEFTAVTLSRGGRQVLHRLDLKLDEPRIGVVGANGSGKSSFARLFNGLLLPTSGHVHVAGLDTRADGRAVRARVGFVFQNPDNQIVYPTVGEDLAFGLRARELTKAEIAARVSGSLSRYGLAGFEDRLVHELSGGERQVVALAGVMVMEPDVLVLDEPTTLLDLRNKRRVLEAVDASGRMVIMVTHDLDLLDGFDRVLLFEGGRLEADGTPAEVVARYKALCA